MERTDPNVCAPPPGLDAGAVRQLIALAKAEDLGPGDVTSELCIDPQRRAAAELVMRSPGVVCGTPIVPMILAAYDEGLRFQPAGEAIEGRFIDRIPAPLGRITGQLRPLLGCERVLLNFLQRLSGVATATYRCVQRVAGTNCRIYDTRKTTPGWRSLEKYAVRCGGGRNHRLGLYDAVLLKDNHLKGLSETELADLVRRVVADAARRRPRPGFIEVEVDTVRQFQAVLEIDGVDVILLDNMTAGEIRQCVRLRDGSGSRVELEASGGIGLDGLPDVARTGVDRIAIGALTHSAAAVDIGLDLD